MKLTTKRSNWMRGVIGLVIALMAVGFATGCSKKLMPPEIEAAGGVASVNRDAVEEPAPDAGTDAW